MKKNTAIHLLTTTLAVGLGLLLLSENSAKAATSLYFNSTAGTYSWDTANWGTGSAGPFTSSWGAGDFARFYGAANYTITVNNDESMAGLYQNSSGHTLIITNGLSGGDLNITTNNPAAPQGFLTVGTTIIYAPITGLGGLEPELGGTLDLFGNNTYSGGTTLAAGTLTYFNNNNSFGTGAITISETSGGFTPILSSGGATITLANNFVNTGNNGGINFANSANTPVITTGTWSLGANNLGIRNNGNATASLTISGPISGTAGVTYSGTNFGTIHLAGTNTYTGTTTIGGTGGFTNINVELDAINTIAASTNITMLGGTKLTLDGFDQQNVATFVISSSGLVTIDFGGKAETLSFANSSGLTWAPNVVFNLADWDAAIDFLLFGTDATGLTAAQLADIEFNGKDKGFAAIDSTGHVYDTNAVPEPATIALGALGGLSLLLIKRRKTSFPPSTK
jgi:autotransporter-associated beta strand protein